MPLLKVVDRDGREHDVPARSGQKLMETLRELDYGISAICGGMCSCATCHVYIEPEWVEKAGGRNPMEEDMLDFAFDVRDNSRLSCQIKVSDALDGLRVKVPEKQF